MRIAHARRGPPAAAGLFVLLAGVVLRGHSDFWPRALAPVEIVAAGFDSLAGVAVDASGAILVTDRDAGTLTRIDDAGGRRVLLDALHGPTGVAVADSGAVFVIDQGGRRLLRLHPEGLITIAASSLRQARAVAVGPDGQVWLSMRRPTGRNRDDRDHDDAPGSEYVIARLEPSGALTPVASGFVDVQGLAVDSQAVYVTMARLAAEKGRSHSTLVRISLCADCGAGPVEVLLRNSPHKPRGVAVDAAGDVFVAGSSEGDAPGVILKRHTAGRLGTFATGLREPAALAFGPNGELVAVERGRRGRVLRFRAPPPPMMNAPAFTNETPLTVEGTAVPGARVAVSRAGASGPPLAVTVVNPFTGRFTLRVPLEPDATNTLNAVATGAAGAGLIGRARVVEVVHDGVPPSMTILEPLPGLHTRGPLRSTARAEDERSGVAALVWSLDGAAVVRLEAPAAAEPFTGATLLPADALAEGPHVLEVAAFDRAGNRGTGTALVTVDRTPPETAIISGPAADIAERTAVFALSGSDRWSAVSELDFAWRLDDGPWSVFDARAEIALVNLAAGEHRFEARARDRAGNEDPTPAVQTFTVRSLRVRILEPSDGALITTTSTWVRGTVEGSSGDVTAHVTVPGVGDVVSPVEGGTFVLEVPVDPALATWTVVARDDAGATAQASVSVIVAGPLSADEPLDLWPPGGLAPLTVRIGLRGWSDARVAIDVDGDGTIEFDGKPDGEDHYATYVRPGVYLPAVVVTTDDGMMRTRRARVEVYDPVALDARLQAVWRGFKDALRDGNVPAAVQFIAAERRQAWAEFLQGLPSDAFADVDLVFTTIRLVEVGYGGAQYEMVAERDGLLYSYAVWFRTDADGRWRLWRF